MSGFLYSFWRQKTFEKEARYFKLFFEKATFLLLLAFILNPMQAHNSTVHIMIFYCFLFSMCMQHVLSAFLMNTCFERRRFPG